jgi:Ca2+-binding EF-hand superfamily protein
MLHKPLYLLAQGPSEAREVSKMSVRALTDDEKAELREQFTNIDKDQSGYEHRSILIVDTGLQ